MLILGVAKRTSTTDWDGVWVTLPDGRRWKILVMHTHGSQVKLGFADAPPDVVFKRMSLCDDQGNLKGERP